MPLWGKAKLTPSKAVELGKGEIVFAVGNAGRFCEGENFDTPLQGHVTLTTHRVVIVAGDRATTGCVHLSRVVTVELKHRGFFSTKPYLFLTLTAGNGCEHGTVSVYFSSSKSQMSVAEFKGHIESSLSKQVWEQQAREEAAERRKNDVSAAAETDGAGLIGLKSIIRRREKAQRRNEALAADAFSDLDSLMDKARDLVKLITRYSEAREKEKEGKAKGAGTMSVASSRAGASGGGDEEEGQRFNSLLLGMGIANPVTKESVASGLFHDELARQLADFLRTPVDRAGGMLSLIDVYCMFNRARGTELVSPDDLLVACKKFPRLQIPLRLRTFASGVMVLQSTTLDVAAAATRASDMVREKGTLSAAGLAAATGVSLAIAAEQLLEAEKRALVARDDTVGRGLVFYPNLFLSASA